MTNPLLETAGLPRFDAITPAHVQPAIDALVADIIGRLPEAMLPDRAEDSP